MQKTVERLEERVRGINSSTAVVMEDVKIIIKSQKETFHIVESNRSEIERLHRRSGDSGRNGPEYFEKYVVDEIKSVKSKTRNILEDTQLIVDIGKHNRRQLDRLDDLINSKGLGRREEKKNPSVQLLDQMNKHMKKEYIDREDIRSQLNIPQSRKSSRVLDEEDQYRKIKGEDVKEQSRYCSPMQQDKDSREVIEIVEEDEANEEVGRKVKFIDTTSSCKRPAEKVWDTGEDPAPFSSNYSCSSRLASGGEGQEEAEPGGKTEGRLLPGPARCQGGRWTGQALSDRRAGSS